MWAKHFPAWQTLHVMTAQPFTLWDFALLRSVHTLVGFYWMVKGGHCLMGN